MKRLPLKTRKRLRKVYRDAAERIIKGTSVFCCTAIRKSYNDDPEYLKATGIFAEHFKPEMVCDVWPFGDCNHYFQESRNHRVTALLLMADIIMDL